MRTVSDLGIGRTRQMSTIESVIRFGLALSFMVVLSSAFFTLMLLLLPWRALRLKICNVYGKINGRTLIWFAGSRPVVHNRERVNGSTPAIFVSNHSSTIDMWMGMWICPMGGGGLAKKEIVKVPGVGQLYLLSGHPLIDRSNRERAITTMNQMAEFMSANRLSLFLWPEGTRSKDGKLQAFKKGFVHAAIATQMPVVPVIAHHASTLWPRKGIRFRSGDLHIEVLEPVDTSDWTAETIDAHVAQVRDIFVAHLAEET
jgi:lysophosphatidate acyltransferase